MKKVILAFSIFASVVLVSCGSKSGQREPGKAVRVRDLATRELTFLRLNTVEQNIYRQGDTVQMNAVTHSVLYSFNDIVSAKTNNILKEVILEK